MHEEQGVVAAVDGIAHAAVAATVRVAVVALPGVRVVFVSEKLFDVGCGVLVKGGLVEVAREAEFVAVLVVVVAHVEGDVGQGTILDAGIRWKRKNERSIYIHCCRIGQG